VVLLTVTSGDFTNFNHRVPQRCTITLTATSVVSGNTEPTASNNMTTVELNMIDKNRLENTTPPPPHEAFINSLAPVSVSVGSTNPVVKGVRVSVGNADYLPTKDSDAVSITRSDGTCAAWTVTAGVLDVDTRTAGNQDTVRVDGGRTTTGSLQLTIDRTLFADTPNAKSPVRCTAVLRAVGPTDPDPDSTNNATQLVIDVLDRSDLP
jgi:hypothetical protein